jgi:DNA-binding MarR family transcriptional regulator
MSELCIPSYDTIATKSRTSKKYVSASIKKLEKAGYLIIDRSSKLKVSKKYSFKGTDSFSRIPYEVLDLPDLTANQRGMLLAVRQYFDSHSLELYVDLTTLCTLLDLTYRTVYPVYAALIKKGYIEKYTKVSKNGSKRIVVRLTDKVNWLYELPQMVAKSYVSSNLNTDIAWRDADGNYLFRIQ